MLPNTYWQLEYIESSGSQYINTSVNLTSSINLKIEFAFTNTSGNQAIVGSTLDYKQSWVGHNGTNFVVRWGEGTTYYPKHVDTNWHTFEAKDGILYFDDVEIGVYGSTFSGTPLHLFRQDYTSSLLYYYAKAKVRTFEIESTRNFIPAMNKYTNVIGLYDDVNDVFYTNAGTGSFIGGKIIDGEDNIILTGNPLNIIVGNDINLIANFRKDVQWDLTAELNPNVPWGLIEGTGTYYDRDTVILEYFESHDYNRLYKFNSWEKDGQVISIDNPYTFEITKDMNITCNIEKYARALV